MVRFGIHRSKIHVIQLELDGNNLDARHATISIDTILHGKKCIWVASQCCVVDRSPLGIMP
jgi:hypothetical protein